MVTAITGVWSEVVTYLVSLFSSITELFYDTTGSSLTFIGTIAVIMAGISIMLLVFNLIRSFFSFRG
jgi:hypothetical protein